MTEDGAYALADPLSLELAGIVDQWGLSVVLQRLRDVSQAEAGIAMDDELRVTLEAVAEHLAKAEADAESGGL